MNTLRLSIAVIAGMAAGGCDTAGDLIAPRNEPFVYFVLNQRAGGASPIIDQRALLLTVGSPMASDYRVAERFEMERVSDGGRFALLDLGQRGRAPVDAHNAALLTGNYALPDNPPGPALGANDVSPGDSLELTLETSGVAIHGAVRVPAAFALIEDASSGSRVVRWPRVAGAGGYSVEALGVTAPVFLTDTFFVVPRVPTGGVTVQVRAMDVNLAAYVLNPKVARSGIDAGFGVFGAVSIASILVQ